MKVPKSIVQIITEIEAATVHIAPSSLFIRNAATEENTISCLDKEYHSYIPLEEWSGIKRANLPIESSLTDKQIQSLLIPIKNLLSAYHCQVVFQTNLPERIQYRVIRERFNQQIPVQKDDYFSFSLCDQQIPKEDCTMGIYCHCNLKNSFFKKYNTIEGQTLDLDEIDEFRAYILEKRYGTNWRGYLGLSEDFTNE